MKKIIFLLMLYALPIVAQTYDTDPRLTNAKAIANAPNVAVDLAYDQHILLNGVDNYISVTNNTLDVDTSNFSVELYFYNTGTHTTATNYGLWNIGTTSPYVYIILYGEKIRVILNDGTSYSYLSSSSISPGWNHLIVSAMRDSTINFYVNSSLFYSADMSNSSAVNITGNSNMRIGRLFITSNYYFDDKIFLVRQYNKALNSSEVSDLYSSILSNYYKSFLSDTSYTNYLQGFWLFNEGGNNYVKDLSGNNNDGQVLGTTYLDENETFWKNQNDYWSNRRLDIDDENISSTAATTALLKLQPGVRLTELWIQVDSVFAATDTLLIGISGDPDAVATLTGLDTAGIQKQTLDFIGSLQGERQLYVKKNQATSSGQIDFYLRSELVEEKR